MKPCWSIVTTSISLNRKPLRAWLYGQALVLFRDSEGQVQALKDRCPHRGAPLSKGVVLDGCVTCPYHGWRFDGTGTCQRIPGGESHCDCSKYQVKAYACREEQGYIWVCHGEPQEDPYLIPGLDQPGFHSVRWRAEVESTLEAVAENLLDATHTHYVHSGLIRTEGKRKSVNATTRSIPHGVEAEYHERQQAGWIMRLLSGGSKQIVAYGRFLLPNIAQLEYRTENGRQAFITAFLTPSKKGKVQAEIIFTYKWGWLCRYLGFLMKPLFWLALRQDLRILRWQSQNEGDFPGEPWMNSPLDLLGPKIGLLRRSWEEGKALPQWAENKMELFL